VGRLGFVKDAYLRTREAVRPHVERAAALHVHPRLQRAVIRDLNLEFCSACNLRCKWCSLDSRLRPGVMKPELLDRLLVEIRDESRYEVKVLNLHHSGDVLLHPRFPDMLERIARERRERPRFPYVTLLTSATHLTGDKAEALLESGAVDWLRFSVDGGNPAEFERIRVGARWDQVLGNVHAFLDEAERRGKRLRTGVISVFETPEPELTEEFVRLTRRVTNYMPRLPHNWVGTKDLGLTRRPEPPPGLCAFVLFQCVVLYDGKVTLCCNDLNAEGVVGDLAEQSLHEVFRGERRREVVRAMREQRRRDLPLCGTCDME
jgi:pyruvate-formate lyase-activating enzyme